MPMPMRSLSSMATVLAGVAVLGACVATGCSANIPVYIDENRPLEALAPPDMGAGSTPGLFSDTDLFVLPVRKPTAKEAQALVDEQTKLGLPMAIPWAAERDFEIEVRWTIKNLETTTISSRVTINGGTEFGDYDKTLYGNPSVADENQPVPPDVMGSGELIAMDAGATRSGIFREDQLREAGLDLEVITRYPPPDGGANTPYIVLERNSTASTIGLEGIPKGDITPAMVRMSILLEATGHAVLDYSVRVRETGTPGNKLAHKDAADLYVSTAALLPPPVTPPPATGNAN